MGKAEENKLYKRNQLLETAFNLFTSKGFEKTSVSDIASAAGVGKGTFYLYFKDKQDIEARLISRRAGRLFHNAREHLQESGLAGSFDDKLIFLINDVVDQLSRDTLLLRFIYKNLSWGIFRSAIEHPYSEEDREFLLSVEDFLMDAGTELEQPELMIYMIIELVSSTCYNVILWNDPVDMDTYRVYLERHIRSILQNHRKKPTAERNESAAAIE